MTDRTEEELSVDSAVSLEELQAASGSIEASYQVLFDTTQDLVFTLAPDTRIMSLNKAFETMTGWAREEWIRKPFPPLVVEEDLPLALEMFTHVMGGNASPVFQVRLKTKGGQELITQYTAVPYMRDGEVVSVLGIGRDVTEQKQAEQQLRMKEAQLAEAQRLAQLGSWEWSIEANKVSWSDELYQIYGLDRDSFEATYEAYLELLHPDDRDTAAKNVKRTRETFEPFEYEHRVVRPSGEVRYIEARGKVILDANGEVERMVGTSQDITERKRAAFERAQLEQEQAARVELESAHKRVSFLAEVGALLDSSLDYETTLARAAEFAVPELADWCAIDMPDGRGNIHNVATAHSDPAKIELAQRLRTEYPVDPNSDTGTPEVLRTGKSVIYREVPDALLVESIEDPVQLELMRAIGIVSIMIVPMIVGKETLGVISMVSSESGRLFDTRDQQLAEEFARRAAIAVKNARLFTERTYIADTLQKSLLPDRLPEFDGLDIAARFSPTGEGIDVGGDFYDLIELDEDTLGFTIGDVCGKGPEAASLTALTRHTLRAAALYTTSPSVVLSRLDRAFNAYQKGSSFCTAIFGRLEREEVGFSLTFGCGGHPLPIVLRKDGKTEEIGTPGMLLGSDLSGEIVDASEKLTTGDSLILYTDGLCDAYAPEIILTPEDVQLAIKECAGLPPQAIADALLVAAVGEKERAPRDDIAVLVIQVTE